MLITKKRHEKDVKELKSTIADLQKGLQRLCKHEDGFDYSEGWGVAIIKGIGSIPVQGCHHRHCRACGKTAPVSLDDWNLERCKQDRTDALARVEECDMYINGGEG